MQVGVIEKEKLSDLLRGISQRRRSGVLEIHAERETVEVIFGSGKIVDIAVNGRSTAQRVASFLSDRGDVEGGEWIGQIQTVDELIKNSMEYGSNYSDEEIRLFWEEERLSSLFKIQSYSGSHFMFRVEHEENENSHSQVSVGQLLLDFAAFEERISSLDKCSWTKGVLARGEPAEREYSFKEREIIGILREPRNFYDLDKDSPFHILTLAETVEVLCREGSLRVINEEVPVVSVESPEPQVVSAGADESGAIQITERREWKESVLQYLQQVSQQPRFVEWILFLFSSAVLVSLFR